MNDRAKELGGSQAALLAEALSHPGVADAMRLSGRSSTFICRYAGKCGGVRRYAQPVGKSHTPEVGMPSWGEILREYNDGMATHSLDIDGSGENT